MIHMGFSGIVAFVLVRVLKVPFVFSLFVVSSVMEIILYFCPPINHNIFWFQYEIDVYEFAVMCAGILFFSSATTFFFFFFIYINIGIPVFFIYGSFCYFC